MVQPFAASRLLEGVRIAVGQGQIVNRDLGLLPAPGSLPPRGHDLETGDLERQRNQILGPIQRRIFLVQHQKNLLGDVVRGIPH